MRIKVFQEIVDTVRLKKLKFALTYNPLLLEKLLNLCYIIGCGKSHLLRVLGCICSDTIKLGSNLHLMNPSNLTLGDNIYFGDNNQIYCYAKINIGKYTFFSHNCCLVAGTHETTDYSNKIENQEINIGAGCWIGAGVTILGGVTIGKGSIIGAGSLVNKDIPPYSIAVGNPCKVIKQRVPAEIIKQPTTYNISEIENE